MNELKAINLNDITNGLREATRPVKILWQAGDTLAFVARGRENRSEFHSDPVDEVMYMIRGETRLHYRTPQGEEKVAVIREGEILYCPAGVPHSPRFSRDACMLVLERRRRADERDRFTWYCSGCGAVLHESIRHVSDYEADPVSRAYEEFYGSGKSRICASCGHRNPAAPDSSMK